jgi:group I intron endonuclease
MESNSGIYQIRNIINNKVYVGSAVNLNDRKSCHFSMLRSITHFNKYLQNSFNKNGENNFVFEVIEIVDDKSLLLEREDFWIDYYRSNSPELLYNIRECASSNLGLKHTDEAKEKISLSKIGIPRSEETKRKMSENIHPPSGKDSPFYGIPRSEETKRKMSENHADYKGENHPNFGKPLSDDTKEKISIANTGKIHPHSEETKKKISLGNIGKIISEECKKKLSDKAKGRKVSDETKAKISEAQTGIPHTQETKDNIAKSKIGKKRGKNTSSKYVGVCFNKKKSKWVCVITFNKKSIYLGAFLTEIEAALAYNAKAIELYGENAKLNIIEEEDNE